MKEKFHVKTSGAQMTFQAQVHNNIKPKRVKYLRLQQMLGSQQEDDPKASGNKNNLFLLESDLHALHVSTHVVFSGTPE